MTNKELTNKFIDLNEKSVLFMEKVSNVLVQLNDNNKLHHQAVEINTSATKKLETAIKEQTKSFNKLWIIFWAVIIALIFLAGAEKVLKFLPLMK